MNSFLVTLWFRRTRKKKIVLCIENEKRKEVHAYNCYSHPSFSMPLSSALASSLKNVRNLMSKITNIKYMPQINAVTSTWMAKYNMVFFFLMVCHISIKRKHWMATVFLVDIWFRFPLSTVKRKRKLWDFEWRTIYGSHSSSSLSSRALHQWKKGKRGPVER